MKMTHRRILAVWLVAYTLLGVVLLTFRLPSAVHRIGTPLMTLLGTAAALWHAAGQMGWRKAGVFFFTVFLVGLLLEALGVSTGLVYGPYHYTDKLGPRFLGLVPYVIPLAWFMIVYASWVISRSMLQAFWGVSPAWAVASLTGVVTTAWDLVMDPMMVHYHHWVWEAEGAYFGIPVHNFFGWWLTVALAVLLFEVGAQPSPLRDTAAAPCLWAVLLYALTTGSTLWATIEAHLLGPALVGFWATLPWALIGWGASRRLASPR